MAKGGIAKARIKSIDRQGSLMFFGKKALDLFARYLQTKINIDPNEEQIK